MAQHWIRYRAQEKIGFGTLDGETIAVHEGSMFERPARTSKTLKIGEVEVLAPTEPSKMIGLVNNFHALLTKLGQPVPEEPLYFLKAPSAFMGPGGTIEQPKFYSGRVVFEGELGIVIGKRCKDVDEAEALSYVLGYTCVNDVTGFDVLNKDPQFAQWARAKSYDGFGIFGPVVASGIDPARLTIRSVLAGEERQNYPVSDMVFGPARLVSAISRDMTLLPGDVIACGTSVGAGRMKPASTIEIVIDGIGTLSNTFAGEAS
jgi:2-keto-4-pentenoate hydratase/2-oxohepta-3-ene-1,7-dioic acid hydratase in catechol pathway